jgi:hypothetical protein
MASGSLIDVHHYWLPAEHCDDVERWLHPGERVHRYTDGALEIRRLGRALTSPLPGREEGTIA